MRFLPANEAKPDIAAILEDGRRKQRNAILTAAGVAGIIVFAFAYAGAFDPKRYADALPTILKLAADAMPPDFSRWRDWGRPLLETLSMSIAGTALAVAAALPLGALAARNIVPQTRIGEPVRLFLNVLRSIPGLIWGVIWVAAVGFGPLPGVLALATHSTGMLGKFFAETMEHVDPAPGDALRSHGVSQLGVLRFSVLHRFCRVSQTWSPTAGSTICVRPPRWGSWARAASASKSSPPSTSSNIARRPR